MPPNKQKLIEVDQLRINFVTPQGLVQAVRDVSFYIRTGEIVGVVGESGSGKTITASSLLGWLPAEPGIVSGKIIYYDQDEKPVNLIDIPLNGNPQSQQKNPHYPLKKLHQTFAPIRGNTVTMIFQEPRRYLNPYWTTEDHFKDIFLGLDEDELKQTGSKYLADVGLTPENIWLQFPHSLSGGMSQRLMIALALAMRPRLLIADEMTTGLDVTTQSLIAELFRKLIYRSENRDRAVVLISHDIAFVIKIVTKLVVMYAGEIVEFGPAELFFDDDQEDNHPYTNALLNVYFNRSQGTIKGDVPSSLEPLAGCPFAYRECQVLSDRKSELDQCCHSERPPKYFLKDSGDHWVRCHKFRLDPWRDLASIKD